FARALCLEARLQGPHTRIVIFARGTANDGCHFETLTDPTFGHAWCLRILRSRNPAAATPSALRGHGTGLVVCAIFAALWANWARPLLTDSPAAWAWGAAVTVAV